MGIQIHVIAIAALLALPASAEKVSYSQAVKNQVLSSESKLTVLADYGGTPIQNLLYETDDLAVGDYVMENNASKLDARQATGASNPEMYPIRTPSMSVGPISANEAQNIPALYLTNPVFIIGYDRVSLNWLEQNLDILAERQAMGMLVNVETPEQYRRVQEIADGRVLIHPLSGEQLSASIQLYHYPAYLDQKGVMR